jgi:hypothetical protein
VFEEFYLISEVRRGDVSDHGDQIDDEVKRRLRDRASAFIERRPIVDNSGVIAETSQETREHLEQLGYY